MVTLFMFKKGADLLKEISEKLSADSRVRSGNSMRELAVRLSKISKGKGWSSMTLNIEEKKTLSKYRLEKTERLQLE